MGADPMCSRQYAGKRALQEFVIRSADGGLVNAFIDLQGKFPVAKATAEPVTLDQRGCLYTPRVLGMQVGQTLQIKNNDSLLHNVHSLSTRGNAFNVSQPQAVMVYKVQLKNPDVIMRIKCDVHSWMTAYLGVEPHAPRRQRSRCIQNRGFGWCRSHSARRWPAHEPSSSSRPDQHRGDQLHRQGAAGHRESAGRDVTGGGHGRHVPPRRSSAIDLKGLAQICAVRGDVCWLTPRDAGPILTSLRERQGHWRSE
jgi:hypothetical protein